MHPDLKPILGKAPAGEALDRDQVAALPFLPGLRWPIPFRIMS